MSEALGYSALGVRPLAGLMARAKPSVSIISPTGDQTAPVLEWSFSSPVGRAQSSYQYQIRSSDGSFVLLDSGVVSSSASSGISISYSWSSGASYQIWLRASDLFDTSDWAVSNISFDSFDVSDYPDEPGVGSIYEIGINGQGYMLSDNPEKQVQRRSMALDPPRFATGETPFSEAVERYTFVGFSDLSGGAGQKYRDRDSSSPTKFWDSEGIDPFTEEGALQLLPATSIELEDNWSLPYMAIAGGTLYVVTAGDTPEITAIAEPGATPSAFTLTAPNPPTGFCSDGTNWYWADGSDIYRNDTDADPVSEWSTVAAEKVAWVGDRIACTYVNGTNQIVVSTLTDAGAEEVAGGRFKYPDSADIPDLTGGDGFMWFIVNKSESSQIHYWQLGSSDTYAAIGLTLPGGQNATALGFYLGNVFVRAVETTSAGTRVIIYRCIPNDGRLTPQRVLDWEADHDASWGVFAGDDRFVFFNWRDMALDGSSGVGCIDLSTGGWAKWITADVGGEVRSVAVWDGQVTLSIDSVGVYVEDTAPVNTGWLKTSLADQGSSLSKVYDEIRASLDPLPIGGEVEISYSTNGGVSYDSLNSSAAGDGVSSLGERISALGRSVGLTITLNATATTPVLRTAQVKLHALSVKDQLVVFPINCSDELNGMNGRALPVQGPGAGLRRVRELENLLGTVVKLQDVDWPISRVSTYWELVDVSVTSTGVFNPKQNRRVDSSIAEVTLRRAV